MKTQTYFAKSVFASKTVWFNVAMFFVAAAELTEVVDILPASWMPGFLAVVALVNLALRQITVRPVALIAPGSAKPVDVPRLDAF